MTHTYVRFAILGVASGSLYALVALAIVIVRRTSGVLNFSSGAVGALSAFLTYDLRDGYGVPTGLAVLAGLLVGVGLGLATQLVVMRLLSRSSVLTRLIATLGVMTTLQGLIVVFFGTADRGQPTSILPTSLVHLPYGITLTEDRLILIGVAVVLTAGLGLLYGRTRFGLATAAVAENRVVASCYGLSPNTIELVNFGLGGGLAALSAILIAPIVGLTQSALVLIIIPALAAALLGRFNSFTLTVAGAILIGAIQAVIPVVPVVARNVDYLSGLPQAVPLLLIVAVTVLRGQGRLARGETLNPLPLPGAGTVRPLWLGAAGLLALGVVLISDAPLAAALSTTFAFAILLLSVVVVTGYAGQLSLAQFAFAGFGAWVAARLYATQGLPFPLALIVGMLLTIPLGLLVALPALRTRGVDLAVATLGLALMIESLIFDSSGLTGGYTGTAVTNPTIFGWHIDGLGHPRRYASVCLVGLVLAGLAVANLRRGRTGRRLLAVRGNERAAASLGVRVYAVKLYAFGIGAGLAALSGILLAFSNPNVLFQQFDVFGSISSVEYATVGGIGWLGGTVVGAALAAGALLQEALNHVFSAEAFANYAYLIAGLSVLLFLVIAPDGLAALVTRVISPRPPETARPTAMPTRPLPAMDELFRGRTGAELVVTNLAVSFGGNAAIRGVSLRAQPGQVLGVMGPNGAGKTTLLDAITGYAAVQGGVITLDGKDIGAWSVERRARAGLGRSFQAVELFNELSVRDNLIIATDDQSPTAFLSDLIHPGQLAAAPVIDAVVAEFGLEAVMDSKPSELSQGQARLAGIARAVCAEPRVIFLDEPASGLDPSERAELARLVRRLADERGLTVIVIEHDVALLAAISDQLMVLDSGSCIAYGPPDQVLTVPAVIEAYVGQLSVPSTMERVPQVIA